MVRYFNVKLQAGSSLGPYNVYYDDLSNIATLYYEDTPATGLTLGQLTFYDGVTISIPSSSSLVIIKNMGTVCGNDLSIPLPTDASLKILLANDVSNWKIVSVI